MGCVIYVGQYWFVGLFVLVWLVVVVLVDYYYCVGYGWMCQQCVQGMGEQNLFVCLQVLFGQWCIKVGVMVGGWNYYLDCCVYGMFVGWLLICVLIFVVGCVGCIGVFLII